MPESLADALVALLFLGEIVVFVIVPLLIESRRSGRREGKQ
jgi:hypothetical protein